MLKPCPHHFDPTCDNCRASMPEDQKRVDVLTEVQNKEVKEKKSNILANILGRSILATALVGFAVLFSYMAVPGFLKQDEELVLHFGYVHINQKGEAVFCIVVDGKEDVCKAPLDKVTIEVRNDGKSCTTILVKGRKTPIWYDCSSAIILVPLKEDIEIWSDYLSQLKAEFESEVRKREETGHRVFPKTR